ncbi:MAG: hypothetical protein A3G24_07850 [Betaproteobacteria bacterium RIFCSPLOWO2_12_FULL_62_13]|nr:MAG: hypothetical protein A3G24_07850 [Betaproteobacteria bacterium RIFCSPLOWO2_12_FULL_62_13]
MLENASHDIGLLEQGDDAHRSLAAGPFERIGYSGAFARASAAELFVSRFQFLDGAYEAQLDSSRIALGR